MQHAHTVTWSSPRVKAGVLVLDGYGIEVTVRRRHLVVEDGVGRDRRRGRFPRATSGLRRLVVLGHSGVLSFEAMRWLHGIGASFAQIDRDGEVVTASGPAGLNDPRLRRAQALAMTQPYGLEIAKAILKEKLRGEDAVLDRLPRPDGARKTVRSALEDVEHGDTLDQLLLAEAIAAAAYWEAWAGLPVPFVRADLPRIPEHWLRVGHRRSPVTGSSRQAANPANALLNYLYAVLEAEARIACLAVGLDPGLGILHADQPRRDSLALDVMEAVRPKVDAYALEMLRKRSFRASDFSETLQGVCRLMPPLTHLLVNTAPNWAREVAPITEHVACMLADAPGSRIRRIPTPLTQTNRRRGRKGIKRSVSEKKKTFQIGLLMCKICGTDLDGKERAYCEDCFPARRAETIVEFASSGPRALARMRAEGRDPAHGGTAARARADSVSKRNAEVGAWDRAHPRPDPQGFMREVLPRLQDVPLRAIMEATGLSKRYCSIIRRGMRVPHPRHWESLRRII